MMRLSRSSATPPRVRLSGVHPRCPVGHVMLTVGVPSETFIEQAISTVESRGWHSHVFGLHCAKSLGVLPPDRTYCPVAPMLTQRAVGALTWRSPYARFARQLAPEARARKIGLLHAHFGWSAIYAAPLAELLDLPLVVTFYGSDALVAPRISRFQRGTLPGAQRNPYQKVFGRAAAVISVSDYVETGLRRLGYRGQIHLIRNGIDLARLQVRDSVPALEPGLRLAFVGRFVPCKGTDVLLKALPSILSGHPSARLELIGDGPQRSALERLTETLGIAAAVTFRGILPHSATLAAIASAHALVVPTRVMPDGATDSSSMVFKEALAMGVPVVATSSGGLPETCPPEYRAELAVPDDPPALARAILRLVGDQASWSLRAIAGRRWVELQFSAEQLGERLTSCYQSVISEHQRACHS
jgi:colanic acid/amylovoran biosynthesis glycosyltransferase